MDVKYLHLKGDILDKRIGMFSKCLELLLRPVARFCLRHSIKFQEISEIFKATLIRTAQEELTRKSQKVSASRIHVMTGVHRQDIARILEQGVEVRLEGAITKVIGQWQGNKRFLDGNKKPRVLSATGMGSEFMELVRSVNKDLNPYTILFELERSQLIVKSDKGVELVSEDYVPNDKIDAGFALLSRDMEALLSCVEWNLLNPEEVPNHHITTEYDRIPQRLVPKVRLWIFEEGLKLHRKIRKYLSQMDADINPRIGQSADKEVRVLFSSFNLIEDKV
jgi:hypothetical protein